MSKEIEWKENKGLVSIVRDTGDGSGLRSKIWDAI